MLECYNVVVHPLHAHIVFSCRAVYGVVVDPQYRGEMTGYEAQKVECLIPGPSDPPEIWTKSVGRSDFIIEWAEPKMYGVKIRGYQVRKSHEM